MSFCVLSSVMLSAQDHIYRRNNGNLVITNQHFLDTVDLEGITHIPGNLQIVPSSDSIIHDLNPLSNITHVCTDVDSTDCFGLTIQGHIRDDLGESIDIINLNALSNLQFIGGVGGLSITNTHLQYLGNFPNLERLSGLTVGIGNGHLDSLGSFPALERIETVSLNDSMGNSGNFSVTLNPGMETLGDFSALTYIGGSFRVNAIDDRSMLRTLGIFSSLDSIKGDFEIRETSVQTLGYFSSLKYIGTSFSVIFNSNLQNLGDFSSLSHVGAITLTDNAMLGNCCGLPSAAVRAVEGEVTVARNGDQGNCSSSSDLIAGCVPMLMPKTILVDHVAGEDTFNLNSVFAWTILVDDESWINDFYYEVGGVRTNFVTMSDKKVLTREAGGGETTIYIGYDMNASIMSRVAEFIIEANDVVDSDVVVGRDTFYLNQNPLPPMLTLITTEDTTIVYDETDPIAITFDVGGTATGWDTVSIIGDKFITLSQYMSDNMVQGMVTITATPTKNTTLFSRTTTITFTTIGGTGASVEKTVTITQNPEPPTLMLTTFSDTTIVHSTMDSLAINFVVDGSATGWRASMTGDASFITLSQNMNDMERGTVMIMATPTMNMGISARTAFINLMTVGGTGDIATARVTIEQGTSMTSLPTLIHSLASDTITVPYNGTMATIGFRVGGSATGWMSSIVYTPAGSNFVNLNVANDTTQRGNVDIIATIMPNETFDERTADIILVTTEGDMGEKASDTIIIQQSALPPPPELMVSTFSDTAIVYNTTDSLFISFVVGGSATGWNASIRGDNFITLSQNMNDMGRISTERETVMVTATPTANDGLTRIDTMILMTTGGVGAAARDTIIITQMDAPPTLTGTLSYDVNYDATSVPITFNVGGGATGWRVSSIREEVLGEGFITSPNVGYMRNVRGDQTLSITLEVNGGSHRTSIITLETVGGTGDPVSFDFIIVQRIAPPPTFMLTSDNVISVGTSATTLTDSIEITFTVGGGALGWTAAVIDGDDDTNDFVTLSKFSGSAGLDTIKVAVSENTGFSRMDTLEITTMGGSGEPLKNTVVITQGGAPPTLMVSTFEDTTLHHNATESLSITFDLGGSAVGWSGTVRGDNFITLSPADADLTTTAREVSVMAVYEVNDGLERKDTIIFTTTGGVADTVMITQEAVPTISVTTPSDGIISIDYNAVTDTTITFDVGGSATGWEVSSDQSFVILDTTNGSSGMGLEVMATVMENMDVLRSATITFSTMGQLGDPVTAEVTITQTGAPGAPTLGVTTPGGDTATVAYTATTDSDSVEIVFTVDNATGWESMISYGDGVDMFVTLTGNPLDTGEVRIKVAVTENDSVARSAKIVLSTTGQTGFSSAKDSLTITQERAPPTLMVSTFEDTTLHHNATEALSITFDLGGSAVGWSGIVRGDNFITLNPADDLTATRKVSVMATYEANAGLERTDTIIFMTTDGVSDTVVITQEAVPTIEITDPSNDTISIAYNDTLAQTITFDVGGSATGWTVSSDSSFVTLSSMSGDSATGIGVTAISTENTGVVARTATITFVTTGQLGDSITAQVMITQDGIPSTLMVSTFEDTTIHHNATEALTITFDLGGGAVGWSGTVRGDNFITLNPADDLTATAGEVSVTAAYEANTGLERTDTIIFTTTGGVADTVVITQEAIPTIEITDPSNDTISIAYNDTLAQTITFDVGGSATGWTVSSDSSFVTLSSMSGDSATGIVVMATSTENTGVARTSTITFVTTGQLGDSITSQVMITQDGIPSTLMVSTFEDTTIHHNATEALTITFDLGGGAVGWSGTVRGDNFITLNPADDLTATAGEVSVMAAYEANTGLERTDTIIFTTTGGVADTVVITQEAVPTIEITDPSNDTISIAYNDTLAQTITFDVGGSATGWEVSSDSSFVTLSSMVGDSATGIGVTATSTENRGEARTATITFVTTGQLGDSITSQVMITQGEAPGAPTLSVTTPSGDTTVAYTATTTSDSVEIAFTVGNAMGWESMISYGSGVDEFVTLTGNRSDTGEVRIKVAVTGNDSVERSAKIVLRTTGQGIFSSAKDSLTITQDGAPPTLMVSTFEDTTIHHNATEALTITFDLGGGAVGWAGIVRGDNFITLNPADDLTATAGEVSVMAAYEANTGLERTDTIIFTTTGGVADTVVITQEAVPTIEITDPSNDTISIAYNDTLAQTITFDVGGSATGWTVSSDSSFVTLSSMSGDSATGIGVMATSTENTGVAARTATITFVTTGQLGDSITAQVMITQAMEEPPTLMLTSHTDGDTIRIDHRTGAAQIAFNVGGGATGWTHAMTGVDFIDIGGDTANAATMKGAFTVTATPTENTDMDAVERSATIRITTIGGAGDSATFAVTITQSASSFDFRVSRPGGSRMNSDGSFQVDITGVPVGGVALTTADELPIQFRVVPSTADVTITRSHFIRVDISSTVSTERPTGFDEDVPARTFSANYMVAANNTGAKRTGTIVFTARSPVGSQTFTVTLEQVTGGFGVAGTYDFTTQTGDFSLNTIRDPAVGHIAAFGGDPSVTTFAEGVRVSTSNITSLDSLIFLESLTTSSGHLIIEGTHLTSLRGLDNLTRIDGNLVIINNSMLTSLEGLEALTHVGGHVIIRGNGALTSLAGLAVLTTIGGDVTIVDNENLASCSGSASLAFAIGVVRDRTTPDGLSTTISGNGSDECNDVDEFINNAPQADPTLTLTSAVLDTLTHDDGSTSSIIFDVAFATWTAESDLDFITLSPENGGVGDSQTVTATASANGTGMLRTATITITATGADGTTLEEMVTIRQEGAPMLSVAPSSFSLGHDEVGARNIVVTLGGSATGWTVSSDSSFVTLSSMSGVDGDSATFTLSPNTGQERTAILMITTDGSFGSDSTVTVMITQEGAPMLSVAPSSFSIGHDEVGARNIVVTLGGSATGWNASSDSAFVDITTSIGVNGDSVTFTLSPNTGRERTAILMITTDGSLGSDSTVTVVIMQGSIPPTLTLVSDAIDTIAHDSTTANDIEITLGGGAEGWSAASSDTSFIKVPASGTGSMIAVSVVGGANTTGAARTATITIMTRGGTGPAVSKMVMLRQEEVPTFVNNFFPIPTSNVGYDGYADFFLVDAGGSATGWTSSTVYTPPLAPGATGFITLDPDMGNKGDDPMVMVTFDSNITGSKRTGTIKITTTGSKGTAASDTVRITQEAAPTLTLVSNDSIRLGYDEMEEQTIRFNVGGSASSWTASAASAVVNAASETASFVNLNRRSGNLEADSATFTLDINTGAERTEIIGLRTGGSQGPNSTVDVVITQEAVPTIEVTDPGNDTISIAYNDTSAQTITFDVGGSATGWTASSDSSFVTLSSMSGDSATGIVVTATSTKNTGVARTATLMITTDGSLGSDSTVTVMITQGEAPPTLMVSTFEDTTIHHGARESLAIIFDLGGSAMGWSGTVRGDNFITLNPADEDLTATGEVTITATYEANTGLERTDTIIFTTTGDVADTVVITQRAAPPTLVVTTNDTTINHHAGDFTITFDLGGSAVGWMSHVTGAGFITINTANDTLASSGSVTIMATYEANDGLERMDSVILMTTGGISDTVVITQKAVPTLVITTNDMTINHDATGSLAITFELGGSAVGWSGTVRGDNFITLDPADEDLTATAGEVSIMATYEANTGMERTDTIIFTTTGGVADTVVITQSAGPPTLVVTTNDTTINHHAGDFTITFTLGGSAVGWMSNVTGAGFITFDPSMDTTAIGEVTIMAIPTENTGMERMDTIVFTTTGGVADTVVITQKAVPTLVITTNDTTINHDATGSLAITFTLGGSAKGWSGTVRGDNFITLDTVMNASDTNQTVTIPATYHANDGLERTDSVILMTTGGVSDTVVITQSEAPPTLIVTTNDTTINHNAGDFTITFTLGGSAVGWTSNVTGAGFITINTANDTLATGEVTIMATYEANDGLERTDSVILMTTGGVSDTVVITQRAAPPTLVVTTNDTTIDHNAGDFTITFELGGSAVGWSGTVRGDNFITLDTVMNASDTNQTVTITATYEANDGLERTDSVILMTTGGVADTVVITQAEAPPTLEVSIPTLKAGSDTTIAYNITSTDTLNVVFTVGGGSFAWTAAVIDADDIHNFLTLNCCFRINALGAAGTNTISIISTENMGKARMDTVVITTMGGFGDPLKDTIVITQAGAPPTLEVSMPTPKSGSDTTIAYGATINILDIITFEVGGGAESWMAAVIDDDNTNNFLELVEHGGTAGTGIIGVRARENMGEARMDTVVITTVGGTGSAIDTIVVTQEAVPTIMLYFNEINVGYNVVAEQSILFDVGGSATGWTTSITGDFVTISPLTAIGTFVRGGGFGQVTTFTLSSNMGVERTATVRITTTGQLGVSVTAEVTIRQGAAPSVDSPTLMVSTFEDTIINHDATGALTITFDLGGSAKGWSGEVRGDKFITLTPNESTSDTNQTVTIMAIPTENTGMERMDTIIFTTTGDVADTVVITQGAAPSVDSPTLMVSTFEDTTINHNATDTLSVSFTLGGSAKGWSGEVRGDKFITLTPNESTSDTNQTVTIMAIPTKNTGMEQRTDTIILVTTGGVADTVVITQAEAPGAPLLNNLNFRHGDIVTTIAHDDTTTATSIRFTVAGGATGWSSAITYHPATDAGGEDFITLDTVMNANQTGEVTVMATPTSTNSGIDRIAMITISTLGPEDDTPPDIATLLIIQEGAPPMLTLISNSVETIAYDAETASDITFNVEGGSFAWTAAVIDGDANTNDFVTLSKSSGSAGLDTIKVTSTENMGETRMDTIVITTDGGTGSAIDTIVVTQEAVPTITLSASNEINVGYNVVAEQSILFDVGGSATGWTASAMGDFVTISPLTLNGTFVKGLGFGQVTTFTLSPNMGVERTATVRITTTGQLGASVTAEVTIRQGAAPSVDSPTLMVSTFEDTTINHKTDTLSISFTLGGSAKGWSGEVRGDNFITLDPAMNTSDTNTAVTIMATYGANTGSERTDTIIFTTTGGVSDTVVITQAEAPPTLEVSIPTLKSGSDTTIAYNISATDTLNVVFTVGGGSFAWTAAVIDADDTHNFLTLNDRFQINAVGIAGTNTISIISTENMGKARMDTVVITTVGGFGDPLKDTIVITQAGAPPTLEVSMPTPKSGSDTTIAYGATINILDIITFEVGGGAESWMAAVIDDDNTNNFLELVEHGGTAGTGIIGVRARENMGEARMDTIVITTVGGFGDPLKDTVVITQAEAPGAPLLNNLNFRHGEIVTTIAHDDTTTATSISFTVAGGATGWSSAITYHPATDAGGEDFITLDTVMNANQTGEVTVMATPTSTNSGIQRIATITISTLGPEDDTRPDIATLLIIQEGAPPMLTLISDSAETIAYDATAIDIEFTVGGGATGWIAFINGDSLELGNAGTSTINIPFYENTGGTRMDTIVITTDGGTGEADTDTVIVTQEAVPTLVITTNDTTINHDATEAFAITFNVGGSATGWRAVSSNQDFIRLDTTAANSYGVGIVATVTPTENIDLRRAATITFVTTGQLGDSVTAEVTIRQGAAPSVDSPTLMVSTFEDTTINHDATGALTITFDLGGSAKGWTGTVRGDNFITLDPAMNASDTNMAVTITAMYEANDGLERTDTIIFTTMGGVSDTVMITQREAPPTLVVTTNDTTIDHNAGDFTITFELGGSAVGWSSNVTGAGFVTINTANDLLASSGSVTIMATSEANDGLERTDTIIFMTMGGTGSAIDTIVVTQEAVPTLVITTNDTTINHDDTEAFSITFNVGGSATGWRAVSSNQDFIRLDTTAANSYGVGIVATVTPTENIDLRRTATITFVTTGQLGDSVTAQVTITQGAAPDAPALEITTPNGDTVVAYTATTTSDSVEIVFTVGNATGWESMISYGAGVDTFVTLTGNPLDTGEVRIKVAVTKNDSVERSSKIILSTTGQGSEFSSAKDSLTITQRGAPPMFMLTSGSAETIAHDAETASDITFNVGGGATGWRSAAIVYNPATDAGGEEFITLTGEEDMRGDVTVTVASRVNTGVERSAVITIATVGGTGYALDTMITITQSAGPPTLMVSMPTPKSGSDTTIAYGATINILDIITFEVGGGAESWMAAVIDDDNTNNFLELVEHGGTAGTGIIGVRVRENTGGTRMDTVVITTVGGFGDPLKDTIVITQGGAPPTLEVSSPTPQEDSNDTTIAYDVGADLFNIITFEVGGGAESWMATVIDGDNTNNFLELVEHGGTAGTGIIGVRARENTGGARMDSVVITTVGGTGEADTDTVIVTQEAVPTIVVTSSTEITIDHDVTAAQTIEFNVGGSATDWTASSDQIFVTLDTTGGSSGTGQVMATVTENVDVLRAATITITTTGQLGAAKTATVMITQTGAPNSPTLSVTTPSGDTTVAYTATTTLDSVEIVFTVGNATGWESMISYGAGVDTFVTLTGNPLDTGEVRIKVAVTENDSVERSAKIILSTTGQGSEFSSAKDSLTITQRGAPPMFMLTSGSAETIAHDAETASDITFNVGGGATGWINAAIVYNPATDAGGEEFITLTGEEDMRGDVTVTVASRVNTGVERSAVITIATVGGTGYALDTMITITQSAGPPTLEVSMPTPKSGSDTTIAYGATINILDIITFEVGGGAESWMAAVIDDDNTNNFLELVEHGGTAGTGIIGVRVRENTGGTRMDTVVITTVGGFGDPLKDTIVITQSAGPPIFTLTSDDDETIAYDAKSASDITFNVGGGATGWWAGVIDGDNTNNFLELVEHGGTAGTGIIGVRARENTGGARMDSVVITTVGGTGEADTDTIIVTQEAVPTISLTTPSDGMIVIDYNAITDTTITFNVGGSATGWTASSDNDFVTLDTTSGASGTGIEVMATVTENMDVLRAATITITTTGQLGMEKTATVMITQTGAPGSPTLSVTTPSGDTTVAYTTDSVEIVFTVGNATGWESMISYGAGVDTFLTLTGNSSDTGEVRIKVAVTENDSVERSAKIILSTTGQGREFSSAKDSLTITQDGAPPTFMLTSDSAETVAYDAETASDITFNVEGGATGWWAGVIDGNSDNNFVMLDKTSGSAGLDTIKVAVSENMGLSRVDTIVITTDGGTGSAIDTIIVTQEAVPTLVITTFNDTTVNHDATGALSISFTLGGTAKGWTSEVKGDGFITLDPAMNASDTNTAVTIMATYEVNTGLERTDTIIFTTTGGIADTVVITQGAVPVTSDLPTLMITTFNDTTINHDAAGELTITFTLGGSAKGWTSEVKGAGFITLDPAMNASDTNTAVSIMATYEANTGVERTDTIIFTTTGGVADTVVITQSAAPTITPDPATLMVSTFEDTTINHDATGALTITFTLGGIAKGWTSEVKGAGFITLDPAMNASDTNTAVSIMATYEVNTGLERTDTIIFTTTGGVADTVVITQSAAPTITPDPATLMVSTFEDTTINHDATGALTITFTLGGIAKGWTSEVKGDGFITLDPAMNASDTNTAVSIMATYEVNTGLERTDTIIFTTTGGIADTVVITQGAVPVTSDLPTLMITTFNDTTINHDAAGELTIIFTLGGTAKGWESRVRGNDFITLSFNQNESDSNKAVKITAGYPENDGVERTDTIIFKTAGDADTIVITQRAVPHTLIITVPSQDITIREDNSTPITIQFTIRGSATGWESSVVYTPDDADFITFAPTAVMNANQTGEVTIRAIPFTNPGSSERVAKIVLSTTGPGDAVSDSVTITQLGTNPELGVSLDESLILYPNPTNGLFFIKGLSGALEIHIHDLLGRQVATYSLSPKERTIDVSDLPSGMYVVSLKSNDKKMKEILLKK